MSDAVRVKCEQCGSTIKAPSKYRGKRVKCPKCANSLTIPADDGPEEIAEFLDDEAFQDDGDDFLSGGYEDYDSQGEDVDEFDQAFGHSSAPPARRSRSSASAPAKKKRKSSRSRSSSSSGGGGMFSINGGVIGGLLMMLIAVVWFVLGLMGDRIFFYPPVMFVIGIIAFFRGLMGQD